MSTFALTAANFADERHLNSSGAERFTPLLAEVLKKALAGEDVSGYFYASYGEMIRDIDRVASVRFELLDGEAGPSLRAESLHGPSVTPAYRFLIRGAEEADDQPLDSEGDLCPLEGLAPGAYKVRVEASSVPGGACEAFAEKVINVD